MRRSTKAFVGLTGALLCCATIAFAQFNDWKGAKLEAKLKRKRPPEYYVMNTAVKLQIKPLNHPYAALLQARLESGLFAQDSRLKSEEGRPETIIVCDITRLDASDDAWEKRTTKESQKVGEQQVWDAKKGKYKTENKYDTVPVTRNYKVVKGGINISYQTHDAKTRQTLDAQNVQANFQQDYLDGNGARTAHEVREALVNAAVAQLVARLTPTTEEVKIFLPRGKVEDFSKLGQAGLWEKMREGVEKMGALKNPKDEAYRQFGIGAANEGLAYQAPDLGTTQTLLEAAVVHYNQAIELKPDEKYFREPLTRIEQSLAQYKKLSSQLAVYAQAKALAQPPPAAPHTGAKTLPSATPLAPPTATPSQAPPTAKALTNQQVIEMAKAGVSELRIIASINGAPAVQFDLSPQGLIELTTNKIPEKIISAMELRQKRRLVAPRRATTGRRKG